MFDAFEVVPAVDVQDGQVVQLVGGERGTGRTYGDPVEAARNWEDEGARTLHLVDLDGAFEGERANASAIERVVEATSADVQVGGGTAAVENPDIVSTIADRYPDGVLVSLDARGGEVVVSGWTEGTGLDPAEAAARFVDAGAAGILFTDVDVEGQMEGVRGEEVNRVVEAVDAPVVASGGVATLDDIRTVHDAGAAAVVVGTALYEGAFTLQAATEAVAADR
jgi:phosphoribosylformimino-5-aminoimidazole carboxamide ribotide isomerase